MRSWSTCAPDGIPTQRSESNGSVAVALVPPNGGGSLAGDVLDGRGDLLDEVRLRVGSVQPRIGLRGRRHRRRRGGSVMVGELAVAVGGRPGRPAAFRGSRAVGEV